MTTPRTTRITVRRPVAAVTAPPVAAVFAAILVWTSGHAPAPPATAATALPGPAAPSTTQDLRRELAAQAASVRALAATVRTLRRRLGATAGGTLTTPAGAAPAGGSSPSTVARALAQAGTTVPTSAPTTATTATTAARPAPPPPPPPPPTTHATTRSS